MGQAEKSQSEEQCGAQNEKRKALCHGRRNIQMGFDKQAQFELKRRNKVRKFV